MISQEEFDRIELDHGCGYWYECCEKACPCAITTENKGLRQDIWDDFKNEQKELVKEYDNDEFEYNPVSRCNICGILEYDKDLIDGLCFCCWDKEDTLN